MKSRVPGTPRYCHHKATGRAHLTLNGHRHYLGRWNTTESRERYDELVARWLASGRTLQVDTLDQPAHVVNEVSAGFLRYCRKRFANRRAGDKAIQRVKAALKPLTRLHRKKVAAEFGPKSLVLVQEEMVRLGYARKTINGYVQIVRNAFRWGVREEMLPPSLYHGLLAVDGLRRGDSTAAEPNRTESHPCPTSMSRPCWRSSAGRSGR